MKFVTLKLTGFDELNAFLGGLSPKLKQAVKREFIDGANEIKKIMAADAPVDQGKLKQRFKTSTENITTIIIENKSAYAPYMEFGTKSKFKAPSEFVSYAGTFRGPTGIADVDPLKMIEAWVHSKGIVAQYSTTKYEIRTKGGERIRPRKGSKAFNAEKRKEKTAAWFIWREIRTKGVKPHPFFLSDPSGNSRMPQFVEIIKKRINNAINTIIRD